MVAEDFMHAFCLKSLLILLATFYTMLFSASEVSSSPKSLPSCLLSAHFALIWFLLSPLLKSSSPSAPWSDLCEGLLYVLLGVLSFLYTSSTALVLVPAVLVSLTFLILFILGVSLLVLDLSLSLVVLLGLLLLLIALKWSDVVYFLNFFGMFVYR